MKRSTKEFFWGDGNILRLGWGGGHAHAYFHQSSSQSTLHMCAPQRTGRETRMYAWGVWLSQMPGGRENGLPPGGTTQWLLSICRGLVPRPCPTRIPKSADDFGILSRSSASVDDGTRGHHLPTGPDSLAITCRFCVQYPCLLPHP